MIQGVEVIHVTKNRVKNPTSKNQCINKHFVILSNLLFTIFCSFCISCLYKNKKIFCEIPVLFILLFIPSQIISNNDFFYLLRYKLYRIGYQDILHCYSYIFHVYSSYGEQRTSLINIMPILLDLLFSQKLHILLMISM